MKKRRHLLLPALLAALVGLAGCSRDDSQFLSSELDEPAYRQGQQLERQGSPQQALACFLKVIAKRNDDAPESHLEVGLIYSQHMKDPIAAIYHFRKYLELQPNSRQAELVRQRIDAAKREFARTLPAQPLESAADRLEMQDQLAHLQRENDQLKAELSAAHGGAPEPMLRSPAFASDDGTVSVRPPVLVSQSEAESPLSLVPDNPAPAPTVRPSSAHAAAPVRSGTARAATPAASGRKYTVQVRDSLYKIATRFYGAAGASLKAEAIYEANRDVMKSASDLKPGMELKIP